MTTFHRMAKIPISVRTTATTYTRTRTRAVNVTICVAASSVSGTSVPRMICRTICDVKSRVFTMKSSARNDSSAS